RCSRASVRGWRSRTPRRCCRRCASSSAVTSSVRPAADMARPTIRRFDSLDALSRAAAGDFAAIVHDAVEARGSASIALSGGSTPKRLFQILAERGHGLLPWDVVDLWWGDERTVPPDHPDSNYGMTRAHLIDPLGLDAKRVHRMRGEGDPATAADEYARALV